MFWMYAVILVILGILSAQDINERKISVWILSVFLLIDVVFLFLQNSLGILDILTGIIPGIFVLFMGVTTKQIAEGDGLVVILLGLTLGLKTVTGILFLALLLSGLYALCFIVFHGFVYKKEKELPFIPFILSGFIFFILLS